MTMDRRILEGIEICRPGSEDLSEPELAEVATRLASDSTLQERFRNVQAFDEAIRQGIAEVPTPEGLEHRLLNSLPKSTRANLTTDTRVALEGPDASTHKRLRTRRRWLKGSLAAAACLAVAAGIVYSQLGGEPWNVPRLEQEAISWTQLLDDGKWEVAAAPRGAMACPQEIQLPFGRWRLLRRPSEGLGDVAVFDLTGPRMDGEIPNCILFVTRASIPNLGATPPMRPPVTQGRLIATWQSGDQVCVLVIRDASQPVLRAHYSEWFTNAIGSA